jgi:hypothetical protein
MKSFVALAVPLAFALVGSCAPVNGNGPLPAAVPSEGETHLRTSAESYTLTRRDGGWATSIDLSFTNPLTETIYVVNCRGGLAMGLERWNGEAWERAWSPGMQLCLSPPIEIAAGGTLRHTLEVWGSDPGRNHYPEFAVTPVEGTYRVVWENLVLRWRGDYVDGAFGDPVPRELRVSNSFVLRRR